MQSPHTCNCAKISLSSDTFILCRWHVSLYPCRRQRRPRIRCVKQLKTTVTPLMQSLNCAKSHCPLTLSSCATVSLSVHGGYGCLFFLQAHKRSESLCTMSSLLSRHSPHFNNCCFICTLSTPYHFRRASNLQRKVSE